MSKNYKNGIQITFSEYGFCCWPLRRPLELTDFPFLTVRVNCVSTKINKWVAEKWNYNRWIAIICIVLHPILSCRNNIRWIKKWRVARSKREEKTVRSHFVFVSIKIRKSSSYHHRRWVWNLKIWTWYRNALVTSRKMESNRKFLACVKVVGFMVLKIARIPIVCRRK